MAAKNNDLSNDNELLNKKINTIVDKHKDSNILVCSYAEIETPHSENDTSTFDQIIKGDNVDILNV